MFKTETVEEVEVPVTDILDKYADILCSYARLVEAIRGQEGELLVNKNAIKISDLITKDIEKMIGENDGETKNE